MKTKRIVVPVTEKQHMEIVAHVEKRGLDSVSAYVRELIREDMEPLHSTPILPGDLQ